MTPEFSPLEALLAEKLADGLASDPPRSTRRRLWSAVRFPGKATAVVGMRRAGKTTFLHQVRQDLLDAGTPRERLPYVNFEDERLTGLAGEHLHLLTDRYYRQYPNARGRELVTWCLDEIQLVPGWERFVRRLLDDEQVEVFVTGSSAALLSREIATALRGRGWEVLLHPFSFEEALRHGGAAPPEPGSLLSARARSFIEGALLEYLETGGFPEAQGRNVRTRRQLLRDHVDVSMLRDVVERHDVTNVASLRWMVRHLLGNAAGLFSVEKFHAALKSQGLAVGKDTVHQLLSHLTDCFLVRTVWMESQSERQRMVNPRKAYPVDPGLIAIFDRSGRANLGHALETVVLLELERRQCDVTYVRTPGGHEVDFLARHPDDTLELIQVCADLSDPATASRELRALAEAGAVHPRASQRLLTLTPNAMPPNAVRPAADVTVQAAHEWLLQRGEHWLS